MCKECGCGKADMGEHEHSHDNHEHHNQNNIGEHILDRDHNHEHSHQTADLKITVSKSVTEFNDTLARQISSNLKELGILCINLMGSPGSGKTTFIEGISKFLSPAEIVVIQGDLESDVDKVRLEKKGIETVQINTHSGCHLNSSMISKALLGLVLKGKKYLIIENVGNLVCPAGVPIGQHKNIVISSTTEGSDKPKKYPYIFIDANLIVISKIDLSDAVDFNEEEYVHDLRHINGQAKIYKTSSKSLDSFKPIAGFLEHERAYLLNEGHEHSHA